MPVTRDNFDSEWLAKCKPTAEYKKFRHLPVRERADARARALKPLREAVVDHHIQPESVANALTRLRYPRVLGFLRARLPSEHRTRMGNFGEVVASEHLVQRYSYHLPIFRLRFADNPAVPMRGEDVLGFVLNKKNEISALCIAEAKTLKEFDARAVEDAHDRLESAHHPYPASLPMISTILHTRGDTALADQVDRLMETLGERPVTSDHWILILHGDNAKDPFGRIQSATSVVKRLRCVNLRLEGITDLVASVFNQPLK